MKSTKRGRQSKAQDCFRANRFSFLLCYRGFFLAGNVSLVVFVSISSHIKMKMINDSFVFHLQCLGDKCMESWKCLDGYRQ